MNAGRVGRGGANRGQRGLSLAAVAEGQAP